MTSVKDRKVYSSKLFETDDKDLWEEAYEKTMCEKYKKGTRNFNRNIYGTPLLDLKTQEPPIYLVPRERGGPSYLGVPLKRGDTIDNDSVQYCPISKGFPMQDLSSFTLGPIVGEGLCLVNAAFSKSICVAHIEGGGKFDMQRKNFWKRGKKCERVVLYISDSKIKVDNEIHNTKEWLKNNEEVWIDEWNKWRKAIALCSSGDFHWTDNLGDTLCYKGNSEKYLNFVQWKKRHYIYPAYKLLGDVPAFKFLVEVWKKNKIPLGLVHPKANLNNAEEPVSREFIREMYDSDDIMCCMPYVVTGRLMGVRIIEK